MRAARLEPDAVSLLVQEVPEPLPIEGAAVVRLSAAFVPAFIRELVHGEGFATPPRPFTLGMDGIGVVESVMAADQNPPPGTLVYCNNFYSPPDPMGLGSRAFLGNFSGPASRFLLERWPDGVYADKVSLPLECLVPIDPNLAPPEILCRLGWLGTAYAGLRRAPMRPGSVVAINGAGGLLGSCGVVAALGLGASQVFAIGRRKEALEPLARLDSRVVPIVRAEDVPAVDVVLSTVDGDSAGSIEALFTKVRRHGAVVLVGAPSSAIAVPPAVMMREELTLKGSYWFGREHMNEVLALAKANPRLLDAFRAETYDLADINLALAAASRRENPLHHVAVTM